MKKSNHIIWPAILAIGLALGVSSKAFAAVTLVEHGIGKANVVLPTSATPDEESAAKELVEYVRKSTGAVLEVRREYDIDRASEGRTVVIGLMLAPQSVRARLDDLSGEGFVIETIGDTIFLVGKGRHGTSFAVYEFLERFVGVRWLWPGEVGEVVPRVRNLTIENASLAREPAFLWRSLGPGGSLWGPYDRWGKKRDLGISEEHIAEMSLWEHRNRFGGEKLYGGHSWGEILPPSVYRPTNPEYYALSGGKREGLNFNGKHRGQLCTTNPEVVQKVIEYCRFMFDRRPELDGVSIGANDGRGFCECERCMALDTGETQFDPADPEMGDAMLTRVITDRMITFGNQVAEAVSRTHPNKKVLFYAYSQFKSPPRRVKAHPNLVVQYTVNHAGFWNDAARESAFNDFAEWTRAAPTFGIYAYMTQQNFPDLPRLVPDLIRLELMELQRLGSRRYQTQAGNGFAVNGLNFYVLGRLLWDPSADVKAIQADYVNKAFGPAAPAMNRYFERFIESWRSQKRTPVAMNRLSLSEYRNVLDVFPRELIDACRQDLEEASRLAGGDYKRRVEFVRDGFHYFEMTMDAVEATYPLVQAGWRPGEPPPAGIRQSQVDRAIELWRKHYQYIEQHRETFVLSYQWVHSNYGTRSFNPLRRLDTIQAEVGN